MTTNRGCDIYTATEKDYDTSGYRRKVCHQWLNDPRGETADFTSPTALETDKQGQTYKRQSQKFADINEPVKGSQRHESSRARRNNNNNDHDFFEPFFGYENRLNKVQNDTLMQTKHNQQMPMCQRNEKVHEKPHRQSQAQVNPHRRGLDIYKEMDKDYDINGHSKKVNQWPVNQLGETADFYSSTALELDKQGQTYKRQSQQFVDINEPAKGSHESSRARRNNNNNYDDFFEPFFGYENHSNQIKNDTAKPKHTQSMPKCQSDGKVHEKPHRQSQALVKPDRKSLEKLQQSRLIDTRRPDKQSTKRKNDENLDFFAHFGDDHGHGKKRKNDDDFDSPAKFGGGNPTDAIIKAANQGIRALKTIVSSTQPTIIQIFIKTD